MVQHGNDLEKFCGELMVLRYIVKEPNLGWWQRYGAPFLAERGWRFTPPDEFDRESSFGYNSKLCRSPKEKAYFDNCLTQASAVLEFHGDPPETLQPNGLTVVDDLMRFMSLYLGRYCQHLWKEDESHIWRTFQLNRGSSGSYSWAGPVADALRHFENSSGINTLDEEQLRLATGWFFVALKEFELRQVFLEAALNWVCLEVQANYLGLSGRGKEEKVRALLENQGFPEVPKLHEFYLVRNDAFHDGQLSSLSVEDAKAVIIAGRHLVRSQILHLLGMQHQDFREDFASTYCGETP